MDNECKFERISKYLEDESIVIPTRSTIYSAGYDFHASEDTVIPPASEIVGNEAIFEAFENCAKFTDENELIPFTLDKIATITKACKSKVTLVPTGIKCKMPSNCYLQLSTRSSLPLKHWLILGNGVGKL